MFCRILCCFVTKSLFYAIYAVLSQNLFCRYLRALAWRKLRQKICLWRKKGQISGMIATGIFCDEEDGGRGCLVPRLT